MGILLNLVNSIMAYNDSQGVLANPLQRAVDWSVRYSNIPGSNVRSDSISLPPLMSQTICDGTRSPVTALSVGSTTLSLSLLNASTSSYRLSIAGVGAFKTSRPIVTSALSQVTLAVNNNSVATFQLATGSFGAAQTGDIMKIKGVKSGESAGVFGNINSGYWLILSAVPAQITAKRLTGEQFEAIAEGPITLGASFADELKVYAQDGIQDGDSLLISGSLSSASWGDYKVTKATPYYVDFVTGIPLPLESGVQFAATTDIQFYSNAKKVVYIEADQRIVARFNLDTSDNNVITPIETSNELLNGFLVKHGHTWKCVVVNKSSVNTCNIKYILSE